MEHQENPLLLTLAVALGIGLLIGAERERSKGAGHSREIAGVRTFALAALLGACGNLLNNPWLLAVFALLIGAMTVAGYLRTSATDPGITTEVALLLSFALGALSLSYPAYAAAAAVVVTVLLAARTWLHDLLTARLTDRELHDALILAAAVLVVLPLLPDRTIDPWATFNPRRMWVVVVLVMAISASGYVVLRLWGARTGLMLAGLLGGLVSSVTTHGAMGQRASQNAALAGSAAAAATLSSVTTAVALIVVVGTVNPLLAISLAPACVAAALASAAYAWLLQRRALSDEPGELQFGRPISLQSALVFGAVVSTVLIASSTLASRFGAGAALAGVALAGLADAHSGAVSAALLERNAVLARPTAQAAVLLSFTANAAAKIVVSVVSGPPAYAWRIAAGVLTSVAAAWAVWLATE
jgi:uncharacterized membrane protein (DUF4010 family)